MRSRTAKILLLVVWVLVLAGLTLFVVRTLKVSTDLRSFMPPPATADQKLLMDQIGDGPGSHLLLLAIGKSAGQSSPLPWERATRSAG